MHHNQMPSAIAFSSIALSVASVLSVIRTGACVACCYNFPYGFKGAPSARHA
jgi:hypothetical protein